MSRVLYKYLPPSRSTVLLKGAIRFSQVGALNDPFESRASVQADQLVATMIHEYNRRLEKFATGWNDGQLTDKETRELAGAKVELENWIRQRTAPHRLGRETMRVINSQLGVLSLSKTKKSLLLWAHYAAAHTGFAIGLDESDSFFTQLDETGKSSKSYDVRYEKARQSVAHGIPTEEDYQALLCQKSEEWKYEEEVRIFRGLTEATASGIKDELGYPVHLLGFPKSSVKEIIFGANSTYALQSEIRHYLKMHRIDAKVYRARIRDDCFEIEFDEVGLQRYRDDGPSPIAYSLKGIEYMFPHDMATVLEPQLNEHIGQYLGWRVLMLSAGNILDKAALSTQVTSLESRFSRAADSGVASS